MDRGRRRSSGFKVKEEKIKSEFEKTDIINTKIYDKTTAGEVRGLCGGNSTCYYMYHIRRFYEGYSSYQI